jgi:hypothetical protein
MQKRIYALWSPGSKGKTTAVKKIAKELYRIFPRADIFPDVASLAKGEIDLVITIGKIKIGITSQGDPGTGLYGRLEKHANHNSCNILVCTTRTYGETVQAVEAIEKKYGFRAVWFTNYQSGFPGEHDYLNQKSAEAIIALMRDMCSF